MVPLDVFSDDGFFFPPPGRNINLVPVVEIEPPRGGLLISAQRKRALSPMTPRLRALQVLKAGFFLPAARPPFFLKGGP